jgi:hypothetical protein
MEGTCPRRPVLPLFVVPLSLFLLVGCESHWPNVDQKMTGARAEFNVAPKTMVGKVKQIVSDPPLSIGVQEEGKGSILTGYQQFPGDWHVARRWQERTQYRVTIIPDWDEPTNKCVVEVRELTQQRAAEGMKWQPAAEIQRPERADELLKQIQQHAG